MVRVKICCIQPVFLAGSLGPDNVADAIRRVRPYGVDVCSRLRSEGDLDPDEALLSRFFAEVNGAAGTGTEAMAQSTRQ